MKRDILTLLFYFSNYFKIILKENFIKTKNFTLLQKYQEYFFILLGGILLSIGVTLFLVPNQIVAGGTFGIGILINYFTGYQLGLIMFCINLPMVLLSMKYINKSYAFKTIFSICVTSFTVDFIHIVLKLDGFIINPILASIFGGVFVGLGLGFIIESNASAGGPAVVAKLLSLKIKIKESKILMGIDTIIVISAGIVFENIESTLLSLLTVFVCLKSLDIIISGGPVYKMVHISTKNPEIISQYIIEKLGIKGTLLSGMELDLKDDKRIIMLAIESQRIVDLKHLVQEHDEDSFIVISDASEIMGRGH